MDFDSPSWVDYVRERPAAAFAALAGVFAVGYGVYLYLQLFHPQWLRGEFGASTSIVATTPPPASVSTPAPATTSVYDPAAPANTYPATPGANTTTPPMPLPGMPVPAGTPASPGAATGDAELASLMNLPARPAAPPAAPAPSQAAETLSKLSALSNTLKEAKALSEPPASRTTPPASKPQPSSTMAPPPARSAAPAVRTLPPASPKPAPAPRAATSAKPYSQTQPAPASDTIELKDHVVINPAPATIVVADTATVADGYRAWKSGRLDAAKTIYRDVLDSEPKNVDALLGLGGIAQQQGSSQEALSYFGRALEIEPRNSAAQAAIIAITGQSDPNASEARLKQLIARDPSAFLHFTLGNLYARQGQWAQAQQSYFQAYSMNAENADYAYNLAVSLEHIGQEKLSITYCRKAVDLSLKQGRASFNQEQVIDRIAKLSLRAK